MIFILKASLEPYVTGTLINPLSFLFILMLLNKFAISNAYVLSCE
uniref:Uncharacterized protein n=1 Tax=Myoviridae sp. ctCo31 TaxID=2825053 RepID=A0A8S5UM37_9CAUD|nr:MAG TPA: hypothetical protein [Myoviridae sp. ctCo31]